jgi:hypothetical protein
MSEHEDIPEDEVQSGPKEDPSRWEWWAIFGVGLAIVQLGIWAVVFLRTGSVSVYAYSVALPFVAFLTLPAMLLGLIRALFRPPAIRKSRTIGFLSLLLAGFLGAAHTIAPPLSTEDWKSEQTYRLPFDGTWITLAGGPERATNYHVITTAWRWAYDFTKVKAGKRHQLDGTKNEDFYCFGEPILAPVSGEISMVENTVPDNKVGETNQSKPLGNYVVIKVSDDHYVYLQHLKFESVTVRPEDNVNAGQKVGECGNSGFSLQPHLHIHAQNSKEFPYSEGLPLRFANYRVGEKLVAEGMPEGHSEWAVDKGTIVEPQ